MYHVNYNVPDAIHNKFVQFFSPADYEKAISEALQNFLEDVEDVKLAESRLEETTVSFDTIKPKGIIIGNPDDLVDINLTETSSIFFPNE